MGGVGSTRGKRIGLNSLQGEAADLYRFWEAELRPTGFKLAAEVLNFPNGMPGDVGLTVIWG